MKITAIRIALSLPLALAALSGCSVAPPVPSDAHIYNEERFALNAPYSRTFDMPSAQLCESSRRALMSQGYVIFKFDGGYLYGRKYFQPIQGASIELAVNVTCVANDKSDTASTAYAVAWQDQFVTKRGVVAASLGVNPFGNLSVPVASTEDALIKVGMETVTNGQFYDRLFALVGQIAHKPVAARG